MNGEWFGVCLFVRLMGQTDRDGWFEGETEMGVLLLAIRRNNI